METNLETNPFISFISDYGFKVTFGNEANTLFLKKALRALIESDVPIKEVIFDRTTFDGITRDSRSGVYDLACTDELGNSFIVEMQLADFRNVMQRLKFYGFQKFNTLVKKGDFKYSKLPKIYCVGILATNIDETNTEYHDIGCIKNQKGAVMDDQMKFITVELRKFDKKVEECVTDLEKLIFTMKSLSIEQTQPIEYPTFWTEEWLKIALHELDTRAMTPDQRMAYEITVAHNAEVVHQEKEKIEKARAEGEAIGEARGEAIGEARGEAIGEARGEAIGEARAREKAQAEKLLLKKEAVRKLTSLGMEAEIIATVLQETTDFVQRIQSEIAQEQNENPK